MKIYPFVLLFLVLPKTGFNQSTTTFKQDVKAYQSKQNDKFKDERITPLTALDLESFEKLNFYKPKKKFKVQAKFLRTEGSTPFEMPTTTNRKPVYEKYGELHFKLRGQRLVLNVYQSHDARRNPLQRSNLFLPFKDHTNSNKTYGGGRFIDLKIPTEDTIVIDFNKAYNPYCAYNERFSCPVVPNENYLDIAIKAGVKKFNH